MTISTDPDTTPWIDGLAISAVLRATSERHGDRDAVVFPTLGLRWSWAELDRRVDAVAAGLMKLGVAPGEHVGIWSMNCPEWVVAQFAVGRIGAVLVNINPAYRLHELETALRQADVATLIVGLPFKTSDFVGMIQNVCPEVAAVSAPDSGWTSAKLPVLRRLIAIGAAPGPGWRAWSELEAGTAGHDPAKRERDIQADDVYNIQFTSGTTGLPKGAMLSHRNVLMNAYYVGERLHLTAADRTCVPVPFYHCFGCVLGTTVCAVFGAALVVPAPSFEPGATLAAIEAERCTALYGVPTMFVQQYDHPDRPKRDLASLRTGIMAGSPCPLPLMEAVTQHFRIPEILIGYGQTEASPIITMTATDDPIAIRVGTVGRVIPGVKVKLVNPLSGADANPDEAGELCAQGHCVMKGYYNNAEATSRAIDPEGWLHTGDLARAVAGGHYKIVGRCKELIIRGGENIYPPEIEEFLCRHPAIAEVAVVGLPDAVFGEAVAVWIVPKSGVTLREDEVRAFCQGQIAHFKVPKYVEIVESLPRTVTGKVRKHVLRDQGVSRYGLESVQATPTA